MRPEHPLPRSHPAAHRTLASPRARRLAAEHGIDLGRIAGHGTDGLEGATFTVSNLGAYGIDNGTPVIFVPQAALMFVGAIRDEVLAIDGRVEVRPAMQIAVAYDHRGIDGATASRFTTNVRQLLEDAEFPDVPQAPPEPTLAKREVAVELSSDGLRTTVRHGSIAWINSAEPNEGPDPVTAFMGALASCLLMSLRVAARARNFDLAGASLSGRCTESGHVKAIDLELRISSAEGEDKFKRLVEVAERGCHIRALLRDDVTVSLKVVRVYAKKGSSSPGGGSTR